MTMLSREHLVMNNPLQDRYLGTLFGLAYGDSFGAPFEFWNADKIQEHFVNSELVLQQFMRGNQEFPIGFTTDDTSQMICLAESLLENGFDLEDQFDRYYRWFSEGYASAVGSAYGIGQHTYKVLLAGKEKALSKLDGSDLKAGGNGALMRSAPLGLYYGGLDREMNNVWEQKIIARTIESTYVTHNSKVNAWTCVVLNMVISLILRSQNKVEVIELVKLKLNEFDIGEVSTVLDFEYSDANRDKLKISGYAPDTLRIAFWGFLTTDNYLESIRKVMEIGGDTDTFAAVTGALSGAYYGYEHIREQVKEELILHDRIERIATKLYDINKEHVERARLGKSSLKKNLTNCKQHPSHK